MKTYYAFDTQMYEKLTWNLSSNDFVIPQTYKTAGNVVISSLGENS